MLTVFNHQMGSESHTLDARDARGTTNFTAFVGSRVRHKSLPDFLLDGWFIGQLESCVERSAQARVRASTPKMASSKNVVLVNGAM
jgi:hypothetical protein